MNAVTQLENAEIGTATSGDVSLLTESDREDIQGLVLFGTKSAHLRYHFFAITDAAKARGFVKFFLQPGPLSLNTAGRSQRPEDREHLVYVAFTFSGLAALGLDAATLESFPDDFREGARRRAPLLGDVTEAGTHGWVITGDEAHLVVLLYSHEKQSLFDRSTEVVKQAQEHGCRLLAFLDADALPDATHPRGQRVSRAVHFGFSDGISQPALMGERETNEGGPAPVKPGAFVLGHGDPALPETNHASINPATLGFNGTYGAFRMFEQDCDAFEEFLDQNSTDETSRELFAARLIGRWRNGVPLAISPESPGLAMPVTTAQLNDFDYVASTRHPYAPDDTTGGRCPIGAHIRRANPRSGNVLGNMGQTIRLIRRGLPYGPPHVRGDGKQRGVLGLFLCGSLKYQFEFVMRHWMNDGLFARGLNPSTRDPLMRFIKTRAAAYLFFPSRSALQLLASGSLAQDARRSPSALREATVPAASPGPSVDPDPKADPLAFVVEETRRRVGNRTDRDAHPKHHGIVKARFQVLGLDGLVAGERARRETLMYGLFSQPKEYTAYIRFSNGSPLRTTPDGQPDLRGMAIKLFEVPEKKLADEERTHDFILASHPQFFVKNMAHYPRFLQTSDPRVKGEQFPLLKVVFRSHTNPLTIQYFSQTPYACGPSHRVKYCVIPDNPPAENAITLTPAEIAARGQDYLREAMAATLAAQDVTMNFAVQVAPTGADVDDATELWETEFTTVARITIPSQEFRASAQMTLAENISFNPWHATEAHKPLGTINEARRVVYQEIAKLRRANGGVQMSEPLGSEL